MTSFIFDERESSKLVKEGGTLALKIGIWNMDFTQARTLIITSKHHIKNNDIATVSGQYIIQ